MKRRFSVAFLSSVRVFCFIVCVGPVVLITSALTVIAVDCVTTTKVISSAADRFEQFRIQLDLLVLENNIVS